MKKTTPESDKDLSEILRIVKGEGPFLIASHRNPDGDSLGSALALLRWFGESHKQASAVCVDEIPESYRFLASPSPFLSECPANLTDTFAIVLDTSDLGRVGPPADTLSKARSIINIDHHPDNTGFGSVNWVDPSASSAALLVYEMLREAGGGIDAEIASCLYVGILADTGGFTFGNTDARTLQAASELVRMGAEPGVLARQVYGEQSLERFRLLGLVLASTELALDGAVAVMCVTEEMRSATGACDDITELASYGRHIRGVRIALLLREENQNVRVSLRSDGTVDVNEIARTLGGGGHRAASGVTLPGPTSSARERLLSAVSRFLA